VLVITYMKSISECVVINGTCTEEIIACINNFKNTFSSGIDGTPGKLLNLAKGTIAPILAKLFDNSLELGEYPDCMQISQTVPVPKCSSPSIPSHCRPISFLPTVSKMFEKTVYDKASNFLNKNKLMTNIQHGFRNNSSTDLAASDIYESLLENIGKGKSTAAVFLNRSKAFDTVDHKIFLRKLMYYAVIVEVRKSLLLNVTLTNRNHCNEVNSY